MEGTTLREYLPTTFGGVKSSNALELQLEQARRPGFGRKPVKQNPAEASIDSSSQGTSDDSDDDDAEYPISHELVFKTHDRAITSITLDAPGARMITGSTDCTIRFHDFATLAPNTIRAFKTLDPHETKTSANAETHPIHQVKFNPGTSSQVLVVSAHPQAKVVSRNGDAEYETTKGDMYLRDMNMTKGHISEITAGTWHPHNYDRFITAGSDSTLRIWDQNLRTKQHDIVVHKSKQAGNAGRSRMTAVAWGSGTDASNSHIVSAALDGSLLLWPGEGPYHRPAAEIRAAHKPDTWTSGIDLSPDGRLVITRGGDDTIKLWDIRKFKAPLNTVVHPSTSQQYPTSNIVFAPNTSAVLTGSVDGSLHVLNPATLKAETVTAVTPGLPLITVLWHSKLNQIFTGSANAETHILFSPQSSHKGAISILSRAPKRHHIDDDTSLTTDQTSNFGISGDSVASGSNPMMASYASRHPTVGLTASGKSRDPMRPHLPAQTPFSSKNSDEKYIRENMPHASMREEDPREALLKYAQEGKSDPMFTKAWAKTQPQTIYDTSFDDEDISSASKKRKV